MRDHGRGVFWVLATGLVVLILATLRRLPPVVASHFDAAGAPNGWSSRPVYALTLIVIGVLLPLGITMLVRGLTRNGPALLNIPAREYWTLPEHGAEAVRRVRAYLWWLGAVMTGTALLIHVVVLDAHTHEPPRMHPAAMPVVLGTVLLGVVAWAIGWYRLMRPPGLRTGTAAAGGR